MHEFIDETTQTETAADATAAETPLAETPVAVNEKGFMLDPSQWTPGVAWFLARRQGLADWPRELTNDHWRVINYMRSYYEATHNAPSLRYTCRALGLTKKRFSRLFPGGLMTVRRISGLPGPRRSANGRELSIARQFLTRNWWEHLTRSESHANGHAGPPPPSHDSSQAPAPEDAGEADPAT